MQVFHKNFTVVVAMHHKNLMTVNICQRQRMAGYFDGHPVTAKVQRLVRGVGPLFGPR